MIKKTDSVEKAVALGRSFASFDLGLTAAERAALVDIKISETISYDNFGHAEVLQEDVARFLQSLGNAPAVAAEVGKTIGKAAQNILKGFHAESAWITLRAFTPTVDYDIPRWHQDGTFFDSNGAAQYKAAISWKGAGTLFHDLPQDLSGTFNHFARGMEQTPETRRALADLVANSGVAVDVPEAGQGAVFVVGAANAAVHSEPAIHEERLFMSVVPGTKAQIEDLRQRWKKKETTYSP